MAGDDIGRAIYSLEQHARGEPKEEENLERLKQRTVKIIERFATATMIVPVRPLTRRRAIKSEGATGTLLELRSGRLSAAFGLEKTKNHQFLRANTGVVSKNTLTFAQ